MKNKKLIVRFTLYILFITVTIFPQDKITNLYTRLQSAEIDWEKAYTGKFIDFRIIPNTNDNVILSADNVNFYINYLDIEGRVKWTISNTIGRPSRTIFALKVSNNGETIIVHGHDVKFEDTQNWVFSGDGVLIFSELFGEGFYYPSSSGAYMSFESKYGLSPFKLYKRDGTELTTGLSERLTGVSQKNRFVGDDQLLIYTDKKELSLIEIPTMNVLWSHTSNAGLWLIDFSNRNCAYNEEYIAIQGTGSSRGGGMIVMYRESGLIAWEDEELTFNSGLDFSSDGTILISLSAGNTIHLINTNNWEIVKSVRLINNGVIINVQKFSWINNYIVIYCGGIEAGDPRAKGIGRGFVSVIFKLDKNEDKPEINFIPHFITSNTIGNEQVVFSHARGEQKIIKRKLLK